MSATTHTESSSPNIADIKGVHPSAIGANTQPDATKTQPPPNASTDKSAVDNDNLKPDYPEQKHAGKVGLGPNFSDKPGLSDKIVGLKEQVIGKLTKNPELATHGHDLKTGELKKKERDADAASDPFSNPDEKKGSETSMPPQSATTHSTSTTEGSGPDTHSTEKHNGHTGGHKPTASDKTLAQTQGEAPGAFTNTPAHATSTAL
ncbi:hypothetical protein C8J57DRAFT_1469628 [Mycena rebaudengoi]|nr:hypothetical protein C8J57DRAFT_1469628 [Mycena rebaudengoi]